MCLLLPPRPPSLHWCHTETFPWPSRLIVDLFIAGRACASHHRHYVSRGKSPHFWSTQDQTREKLQLISQRQKPIAPIEIFIWVELLPHYKEGKLKGFNEGVLLDTLKGGNSWQKEIGSWPMPLCGTLEVQRTAHWTWAAMMLDQAHEFGNLKLLKTLRKFPRWFYLVGLGTLMKRYQTITKENKTE